MAGYRYEDDRRPYLDLTVSELFEMSVEARREALNRSWRDEWRAVRWIELFSGLLIGSVLTGMGVKLVTGC